MWMRRWIISSYIVGLQDRFGALFSSLWGLIGYFHLMYRKFYVAGGTGLGGGARVFGI